MVFNKNPLKFEDIERVIINRESDRKYHGQAKKDKHDLQDTTRRKLNIEQHEPNKNRG